jgi:hypothetical protein
MAQFQSSNLTKKPLFLLLHPELFPELVGVRNRLRAGKILADEGLTLGRGHGDVVQDLYISVEDGVFIPVGVNQDSGGNKTALDEPQDAIFARIGRT